ncbi:MAG TPA: phospholipase D-like domain-containing protein [Leptospiraceae bacterium]|nr:phospholipase D-like domain-containing protein [Leptospiraceae bacterium]HMW04329.1 phospholipase D-like domain-containing protein [Leptospiraceae bacterium]HMX31101.1 phospholipase D-like domain-containing protein [Leptospiraceae bacterium]HMY31917.1 phospholipase D-like domain-containing protein [Leptospiraceae bacterium]HMZ65384.1 phospholipase D-like domain-containing protein [Leptospiraceae bacterium]
MKILILLIFLFGCGTKKANQNLLLSLITENPQVPKAFFSYPGRASDEIKKKEVIEAILDLINNSQFSLKIYAYSLNNPEIISALKEADKRGVKIEIVGDNDQKYDLLKENGLSVRVWKQSGLHHIKVILSDNKTFFTGTGNFSRYGLTKDWNGYIQFEIEKINRARMNEFLSETLSERLFKTNGISFINSPEDGYLSQDLLLNSIDSAKSNIEFLIFDQYDPVMSHSIRQASTRGIGITGVYNSPVDPEGLYLNDSFYGLGSNIYKDGNEDIIETESFSEGGLLHHKTMLIDRHTLLSGSYNYSTNARDSNREILFLTNNPILVTEFQREVDRVKEASYLLPKKNYYHYPRIQRLLSKSINADILCLPESVNSPIIELGSGIWKTYLYYPKVINKNCFSITDYANISSGLTHGSRSDFFSLTGLWDSFKVYDRSSDLVFLYESEYLDPIFYSRKRFLSKNPKYLSFTNSRVYFEMREDIDFAGREMKLWIPGKEMRRGRLEQQPGTQTAFFAPISTNSSERFFAAVWIEMPEEIYFFCYQDRNRTNRDSFEFILGKIEAAENLGGQFETACLSNSQ